MSRLQVLKKRLEELEIQPKRSLGQNFLVGDHVIERITDKVKSLNPKNLIEVGPGLGALTEELLKFSVPLQVIELDRKFSQVWRDRGVKVFEGDALKFKWNELNLENETILVSNLPYQIGGHLIIERSLEPELIRHMVLMFQKEVAQRIMAEPSTKDYSFLTVVAQTFWNLRVVVDAGPNQFYPAPNVSSRVLWFSRKGDNFKLGQEFVTFVKEAFAQRRKLLVKNLGARSGRYGVSKDNLIQWLRQLELSDKVRAEELSPSQYQTLFGQFKDKKQRDT